MQGGELRADLKLPVSETDGIELKSVISSRAAPLIERSLEGYVRAQFQNLDFITVLVPEL